MPTAASPTPAASWRARLDRFASDRPDVAFMAPYLLYLLLLGLKDRWPELNWAASLIRGVLPLLLVWLLRRHYQPWGRADWHVALPAGVIAAFGWFYGQYLFNSLGVPHRLPLPPLFKGEPELIDPTRVLGEGGLFWLTAAAHIAVASTTVGFVEEIFWRSFLLRAMIDWHRFEKLPLGKFTWFSFLGTSLLSAVQHPDNWAISILCWFLFNGVMYWRRSLMCCVIVHCTTNLVLYAWVLYSALQLGDAQAWMHLSLASR